MSFLKRVHCHENKEREDNGEVKKEGRKVEKREIERIIKRMSERERREVNDRVNSSVTARNGDVHKARWFF